MNPPFFMAWKVPFTAMGKIGDPVSFASRNAPDLNDWICPSLLRVPSGKIIRELPFFILATALSIIILLLLPRDRSREMYLFNAIFQPTKGIMNNPFFATHLKGKKSLNRTRISAPDW